MSRRELERAGWRTTLDYRENHERALDGRLVRVEPIWTAEAEWFGDEIVVAVASGSTADGAWTALAERIAVGAVERRRTVGVTVRQRSA